MENGREHYSERLDRIEAIIEATASRQGEIEDEFVRLLKAQVVMQDEMSRAFKASNARMDRTEAHIESIREGLAEAGDKINALINLMDHHLHDHRNKS